MCDAPLSKDLRAAELLHWLNTNGYPSIALSPVSGDASARRYFRFQQDEQSYIAVDTPLPEPENDSFVALSHLLRRAGLKAPVVHTADTAQGWMVIEDFGSRTFADALADHPDPQQLYHRACALIAELQSSPELLRYSTALPSYRAAMVVREIEIFIEWCLQKHLGLKFSSVDLRDLDNLMSELAKIFSEQPQTFVHRDFHSRNLMLLEDNSLGLIDFQGAVQGPMTYDWVSLLRDCYHRLPDEQVQLSLHSCYEHAQRAKVCRASLTDVQRWFDCTGVQRHLKAVGIFCRLHHREQNSAYLADIPRTFTYVLDLLSQHTELGPLERLVSRHKLADKLC